MSTVQIAKNPFALLMDPESVFAAMARSDRLVRLKSQVCRPLDKPLIGRPDAEAAALDELADDAGEPEE